LKYKAFNNNLIVDLIAEKDDGYELDETGRHSKKTGSGIVLVKTEDTKVERLLSTGKVVSAGRGIVSGGKIIDLQCKKDDIIYFYKDMGIPLKLEGSKELYLLKEENVICGVVDEV
jgi:co-chaperonin GroES (HSP10)